MKHGAAELRKLIASMICTTCSGRAVVEVVKKDDQPLGQKSVCHFPQVFGKLLPHISLALQAGKNEKVAQDTP